jgi:hypothetical protein
MAETFEYWHNRQPVRRRSAVKKWLAAQSGRKLAYDEARQAGASYRQLYDFLQQTQDFPFSYAALYAYAREDGR